MYRIRNYLVSILKYIAVICIVGLTVVVALQVITRLLGISFSGGEELARFMLIWLTFSGCSVALAEKMHLSVNFFVNLTPERIQQIIYLLVNVVIILFYVVIAYFGFQLSIKAINTLSPSLHWSMGMVYGVLPVTSIFTIYILTIDLIREYILKNKEGHI